jgi:integrase
MTGCRPLTAWEVGAVLNAFVGKQEKRDRTIFLIGIHTGLRITSILQLQTTDVLLNGGVASRIRVARSTTKGQRSGFDIPLHSHARAAVYDYARVRIAPPENTFLFPGRSGIGFLCRGQAWRALRAAFRRAGIYGGRGELGCHATRKTFARRIYEALNFDLIQTSRALHHADISSTIEYLSFDEDAVDQAILNVNFSHQPTEELPGFATILKHAALGRRYQTSPQ